MADNKNQHFVPRCYLKPFTAGGEGRAINLFNLRSGKAVPVAAVKRQCSGDYFYGDDLRLEKVLQKFEGDYAGLLNSIRAPGYRLSATDADRLREFWLLQYMRTDAACRRTVEVSEELDADLGGLPAEYKTDIKQAVQTAMKIFFTMPDHMSDLGVRLLRNTTKMPFITSDNPAVMTNRWHLDDKRARGESPGIGAAGMIGFLPITPTIGCVLFDRDVHTIGRTGEWIDVSRREDVEFLNEQQILNCQANIYFSDWEDRECVASLAARSGLLRPPARYKIHYAVLEREENGSKAYREVDRGEAVARDADFIHMEMLTPRPSRWPSFLAWRSPGFVYDSHSGMGFARAATRDSRAHYERVRIRK